jgi:soluble lytic murein transglycosylase-like protein
VISGRTLAAAALLALPAWAWGGAQEYEPLSASVQSTMSAAVDEPQAISMYSDNPQEAYRWLLQTSGKLEARIPDRQTRVELLKTIHYEATRAGLDPQLVLAVIQVESSFRKYAVSSAGARGLMQVMPFWVDLIGNARQHNLFHLRTNLRFGCTILRHYLDVEHGNLYRALGRYNGSLGRPDYPRLVMTAAQQWQRPPTRTAMQGPKIAPTVASSSLH